MKAEICEVDLADYLQDVDTLLAIAFQIAIHNRRTHPITVVRQSNPRFVAVARRAHAPWRSGLAVYVTSFKSTTVPAG